jgi:cell division transport system permease protein
VSRVAARIRYYAVEAWEEFRHSPGPNLLAASVLAASLFVASALLLVLSNVGRTLEEWGSRLRVDVFLADSARPDEVEALRADIEAIEGVARVAVVDKDEALARFRAAFGALSEAAEELEENPLPVSLEAYLDPVRATDAAQSVLEKVQGEGIVDEVRWDRPLVDRIGAALRFVRMGGGALGAFVFGALTLVMAGVLRLAVLARRDEIEIMRLVGASSGMVRGPFLLAGAVQGAAGAVAALGLLEASRRAAVARAAEAGPLVDASLGAPLPIAASFAVAAVGVVVGFAGAWVAVGAFGRPPQPQKSKTM